jgi:hypothetical protein
MFMAEAFNNLYDSNVINIFKNKVEDFDEKMIRAKELSKIFIGTSQATYDNWFKAGLINRYKVGGGVYYKLSEVKTLIENSKESNKEV